MQVLDPKIYERAKNIVYKQYAKHSAYRSGALVSRYKQMGGRYGNTPKGGSLKRWFMEKWRDVGRKSYPVYRPTVRVSNQTPLTINEIDKDNL